MTVGAEPELIAPPRMGTPQEGKALTADREDRRPNPPATPTRGCAVIATVATAPRSAGAGDILRGDLGRRRQHPPVQGDGDDFAGATTATCVRRR